MGGATYRRAGPEDLPKTADIYISCLRHDYSFLPEKYLAELDREKEVQYCREWIKKDNTHNLILLAIFKGDIAGYVSTGLNTEEPQEFPGELTGLFVHPDFRGLGLGLGLMRGAAGIFLELGIEKFVVYNFRRSRANRFYRDLGGILLNTETQKPGGMPLLTDVFGFEAEKIFRITGRGKKRPKESGKVGME